MEIMIKGKILLILFVCFFFMQCSDKEKELFHLAENNYNSGKVVEADSLYQNYIQTYPTGQWRTIAENQRIKCENIFNLEKEGYAYLKDHKFDLAKNSFFELSKMNTNYADTIEIFSMIDIKRDEYKKLLAEKYKQRLISEKRMKDYRTIASAFILGCDLCVDAVAHKINIFSTEGSFEKAFKDFHSDKSLNRAIEGCGFLYKKLLKSPPEYKQYTKTLKKFYNAFLTYTKSEYLKDYGYDDPPTHMKMLNKIAVLVDQLNESRLKLVLAMNLDV